MPAVFKLDDAPLCGRYFDIGSSNVKLGSWGIQYIQHEIYSDSCC